MKLPVANCRLPGARIVPIRSAWPVGCAGNDRRSNHSSFACRAEAWRRRVIRHSKFHRAFTLLEVMIAIAIFFVASFAILSLVGSSLDNVRRLQRPSVDASPVLARYAATNSLVEGAYRGSLGDPDLLGKDYRDYNYAVDIEEIRSNHLYRVECVITPANGKRQVISDMSTVLFKPQSPPGSLDGGIGLTGH